MGEQARQHREQMAVLGEHISAQDDEMNKLVEAACGRARGVFTQMACGKDELKRFRTFLTANFIPNEKKAQVFLAISLKYLQVTL